MVCSIPKLFTIDAPRASSKEQLSVTQRRRATENYYVFLRVSVSLCQWTASHPLLPVVDDRERLAHARRRALLRQRLPVGRRRPVDFVHVLAVAAPAHI